MPLRRIISGGQSGVDRAALDVALALGIECGGWCPRGRRAEDGRIPDHYPLRESRATRYDVRTRLNVRDSDASLILVRGVLEGGTALTVEVARALRKPFLIQELGTGVTTTRVAAWLADRDVAVLNVAGPRESKSNGIYAAASAFLHDLLEPIS